MKQKFREAKLGAKNLARLALINRIIEQYKQQGYRLSLRQLYYQLVTKNVIANQDAEYKKLGVLLKEGRMAGIVDWEAIVDRLRKPSRPAHWDEPKDIIEACATQYRRDRMKDQDTYIEVWVEKDALSEVLGRVTEEFGINICVNRGYSSASAMYDAYNRFDEHRRVRILYVGDFDPSGLDMIRDITDRITEFLGDDSYCSDFEVVPIALTKQQIADHQPPPNPAKTTDARYSEYALEHGTASWEVDSLPPEVLDQVLREAIEEHTDMDEYEEIKESEEKDREAIKALINHL